ncbi:hypothetical protein [Streptomyces sp. NPDC093111]|uniref:hypothetical protein n=1 Tax=Streptomyces sp. NPDC093111 TaxID=3154978 RepID=UPI00343B7EA0
MSITSPIPVLRGSGDSVLQSDGDALLLRRADEEARIPLAAIGRVRAEGRAVEVVLVAADGAEAAVHRVDGVSGAAATVFAEAVNRTLPERAEGAALFDGSALVTVRTLSDSEEPGRGLSQRDLKRLVIGLFLALLLASVANGVFGGSVGIAVLVFLSGSVGAAITLFGIGGLWVQFERWRLPRYGITVIARKHPEQYRTYIYTDTDGVARTLYGRSEEPEIEVAYHPRNPRNAVVRLSPGKLVFDSLFSLAILLFGLAVDTGTAIMAVGNFLGEYTDF